ncbi:MAG: acylneuraminate cytidylyltransferase family protein [Spirochaetia bacterium]|nr:acylneuraminate cytidylyltransferase family protein [Spirochaetia bacterium]
MIMGVIPARGGSKGIPKKNIRVVAGRPLIEWTIESAASSTLLSDFVVSTDSEEIGNVAQRMGAKVHWRPAHLASDEAKTIDVIQHIAVDFRDAQSFVVLQPTSPVRDVGLIDECIQRFQATGSDNLATGYYCKYLEFGTHNNVRRQDYTGFFYDDGNVYVLARALVEAGRWCGDKIERHVIARHQNFEIDDDVDLIIVECLLKRYLQSNISNS